jgi:hypothetical protein
VDEATRTSGTPVGDEESGRTPDQIRVDIEETRQDLGDTVEQLAAKTDVKAQAEAKADEIKQNVAEKRVPIAAVAVAVVAVIVGIVLIRR